MDVLAWQHAHKFVLEAYRLSGGFPRYEIYALGDQLRRASVSIAANIAEGFRRRGRADKLRFLNIAQSSLEECRYYLLLASDLRYGDCAIATGVLEDVSRLLNRYVASVSAR